jgi:hypothetical protein
MIAKLFGWVVLSVFCAGTLCGSDWPQWRGMGLDGRSDEAGFPLKWSASENVAWRTEVPGGHSSPVVYRGRVYLTACDGESGERLLMGMDRRDGKMLWRKAIFTSPLERKHGENSHASSTPACAGERVFGAFLDGKEAVVFACSLDGDPLWQVRPGIFSSVHGFCSTPILHKDLLIVNCDHDGDGFVVALSQKDGREVWRIDRPNKTRSYCTPIIRQAAGRLQMVMSGSKCVSSYDPDTGKLIWSISGPTDQFVASPVFSEVTGLFYVSGGFPDHHILAIRPDGQGDVSSTHVVWHHHNKQGVAYVPSPIIEGGYLLINDDQGFAHAFDAKNGEIVWKERFGRTHASLCSSDGKILFINDNGVCRMVDVASGFKVIAENDMKEMVYASPALSGGEIFLRTARAMYCVRGGR